MSPHELAAEVQSAGKRAPEVLVERPVSEVWALQRWCEQSLRRAMPASLSAMVGVLEAYGNPPLQRTNATPRDECQAAIDSVPAILLCRELVDLEQLCRDVLNPRATGKGRPRKAETASR